MPKRSGASSGSRTIDGDSQVLKRRGDGRLPLVRAGDPILFRAIRRVWELGYRTIRPRFPAGVHKHRSLTSKNALQESWADANFSAYQQRLKEEMTRLQDGEL